MGGWDKIVHVFRIKYSSACLSSSRISHECSNRHQQRSFPNQKNVSWHLVLDG